jgi:hypothetical protein
MANRLLNMVGGAIERRRKKMEKVMIGVVLGQFSSQGRLSSLDRTILSYFVRMVSPLTTFYSYDLSLSFQHG